MLLNSLPSLIQAITIVQSSLPICSPAICPPSFSSPANSAIPFGRRSRFMRQTGECAWIWCYPSKMTNRNPCVTDIDGQTDELQCVFPCEDCITNTFLIGSIESTHWTQAQQAHKLLKLPAVVSGRLEPRLVMLPETEACFLSRLCISLCIVMVTGRTSADINCILRIIRSALL